EDSVRQRSCTTVERPPSRASMDASTSAFHRRQRRIELNPSMSPFALESREERALIINDVAARMGAVPLIVEKDFWVCWTLGRIFENAAMGAHVVFKGGTSLSMVYGAIQRFSEDLDLAISP